MRDRGWGRRERGRRPPRQQKEHEEKLLRAEIVRSLLQHVVLKSTRSKTVSKVLDNTSNKSRKVSGSEFEDNLSCRVTTLCTWAGREMPLSWSDPERQIPTVAVEPSSVGETPPTTRSVSRSVDRTPRAMWDQSNSPGRLSSPRERRSSVSPFDSLRVLERNSSPRTPRSGSQAGTTSRSPRWPMNVDSIDVRQTAWILEMQESLLHRREHRGVLLGLRAGFDAFDSNSIWCASVSVGAVALDERRMENGLRIWMVLRGRRSIPRRLKKGLLGLTMVPIRRSVSLWRRHAALLTATRAKLLRALRALMGRGPRRAWRLWRERARAWRTLSNYVRAMRHQMKRRALTTWVELLGGRAAAKANIAGALGSKGVCQAILCRRSFLSWVGLRAYEAKLYRGAAAWRCRERRRGLTAWSVWARTTKHHAAVLTRCVAALRHSGLRHAMNSWLLLAASRRRALAALGAWQRTGPRRAWRTWCALTDSLILLSVVVRRMTQREVQRVLLDAVGTWARVAARRAHASPLLISSLSAFGGSKRARGFYIWSGWVRTLAEKISTLHRCVLGLCHSQLRRSFSIMLEMADALQHARLQLRRAIGTWTSIGRKRSWLKWLIRVQEARLACQADRFAKMCRARSKRRALQAWARGYGRYVSLRLSKRKTGLTRGLRALKRCAHAAAEARARQDMCRQRALQLAASRLRLRTRQRRDACRAANAHHMACRRTALSRWRSFRMRRASEATSRRELRRVRLQAALQNLGERTTRPSSGRVEARALQAQWQALAWRQFRRRALARWRAFALAARHASPGGILPREDGCAWKRCSRATSRWGKKRLAMRVWVRWLIRRTRAGRRTQQEAMLRCVQIGRRQALIRALHAIRTDLAARQRVAAVLGTLFAVRRRHGLYRRYSWWRCSWRAILLQRRRIEAERRSPRIRRGMECLRCLWQTERHRKGVLGAPPQRLLASVRAPCGARGAPARSRDALLGHVTSLLGHVTSLLGHVTSLLGHVTSLLGGCTCGVMS